MNDSPVIPALPKLDDWQTVLFQDMYKIATLHPLRMSEARMVLGLVLAQLCAEEAIVVSVASRAGCAVENALRDTSHIGQMSVPR